MSIEFLNENFSDSQWSAPLEPLSCSALDTDNSDKFLSYGDLKHKVKDYEDTCRPGN